MPRNWCTTLFLATQTSTQPDEAIYPALSDEFESPSLDNVPSDPIWYKLPDSSRQNVSDTRLTLMKIRRMQRREKECTREEPEVMEEESLANSLATISIDSESSNAQESLSPVRSFTSTFKPQYGTRALTGNVLKPEAHPSLGDSTSNASSERRSSQVRRNRNYHPYQYRQPSVTQDEGDSPLSLAVAVPRDWSTFSNDPMGSMNCKPTAQSDGTQQAMIDCRKGSTGSKRDISTRMYIEGTCSSKEDYDKYYQEAYDKAKKSCSNGHHANSNTDDDETQSDDSTDFGYSGPSGSDISGSNSGPDYSGFGS